MVEALACTWVDCSLVMVPAEVASMSRDFDALVLEVCAVVDLLPPFVGVFLFFFDVLALVVAAAFSCVEVLLLDFLCAALVFAMMWMMMLACG